MHKSFPHVVLQESVLGPILFLVAISNINGFLDGNTLLFVDYLALLGRGKTSSVAEEIAVGLLKSSGRWFHSNRLRLNQDKTQRLRGYCVLKAAPRLPTTAV